LIVSHYCYVLFETPMNRYIKNVLMNRTTKPNQIDGSYHN